MKSLPKRLIFVTTLVSCFALTTIGRAGVVGQTMEISGHVKDDLGNAVADVNVVGDNYVGDVFSAKTDTEGFYSIELRTDGNYRVIVNETDLAALDYDCPRPGTVTITSSSVELDFTVYPLPLQITNSFLPEGTNGSAYRIQLGAKGGRKPHKWQVAPNSTNLPAGLALTGRGLLSGLPTTNSVLPITVQVMDSQSATTNKILLIHINPFAMPASK